MRLSPQTEGLEKILEPDKRTHKHPIALTGGKTDGGINR
jgi:hypothetical protein